jgi:hypothetical protein
VKVMFFETSDGLYWVRLPVNSECNAIMLRIVRMACNE